VPIVFWANDYDLVIKTFHQKLLHPYLHIILPDGEVRGSLPADPPRQGLQALARNNHSTVELPMPCVLAGLPGRRPWAGPSGPAAMLSGQAGLPGRRSWMGQEAGRA
jgi:hypothetical protein